MHNLVRLAFWVFLLLVFFASIGFSFLNTTSVPLSFGVWEFAPQPVAIWIVSAFALGGILGLLFGTGFRQLLKSRREIRRLQKELDTANQQIAEQRGLTSGETE